MSTYISPLEAKSVGNNFKNQEVKSKLKFVYNNYSLFLKGIDTQLDMSRKPE